MNRHCFGHFCLIGGLYGFFWVHVYLVPIFIVLATFHYAKIKGAKFFAYSFKMFAIATVSTEVDAFRWGFEYPTTPK